MGKLIHKNKNDTKLVFSKSGFTLYSVLILISIVTIYFSAILTDIHYLQKQTINQNHESQAKPTYSVRSVLRSSRIEEEVRKRV